ncbi:hypothetical protein ACFOY2_08555 [Nonomuraea purpurea]|uniref:Uncharacterized protein n=1 Tax=Nonomuraea purpurea TaxID=1849276 RepID=A0ABV8G350_9ACTN
MDTALGDGLGLEELVRRELREAGFTVEPTLVSAEGGLGVWLDPTRGVVITWGTSTDQLVKYATVRAAVLLALRTVLVEGGHQIREDSGGLELVVIS